MTVTLRFRPVVFGALTKPSAVLYVGEDAEGRAYFQDLEVSWPLDTLLEEVTAADLPGPYRAKGARAILLPVQEVHGKSLTEASRRLDEVLDRLQGQGVKQVRLRASA